MAERKYVFGNNVHPMKDFVCLIGASNELPSLGDFELEALYDRFLFRCHVKELDEQNLRNFLLFVAKNDKIDKNISVEKPQLQTKLLNVLAEKAQKIKIPNVIIELLMDLQKNLLLSNIQISDRRLGQIVYCLKMVALLNGHHWVLFSDCWILQYVCWNQLKHIEIIENWWKENCKKNIYENAKGRFLFKHLEKQSKISKRPIIDE